jgi:hypothetical protein
VLGSPRGSADAESAVQPGAVVPADVLDDRPAGGLLLASTIRICREETWSSRRSRAGWFLGQDAELIALGVGERDPAAAVGPPVVGQL